MRARMPRRNLGPQGVGGNPPRGIPVEAKRAGDRLPEEGIAEGGEDQPERALGHMMLLMSNAELGDEAADGVENRVQRVTIAGQDHPGGKGARAFAVERIERAVDDVADVLFADARPLDRFPNCARNTIRDGKGELGLQSRRRSEMMKEVGVRAADFRGDGLERDGLRALLKQELPRGFQRGGTALFGVQAFPAY